jgi:hypothetical protein
MVWIHGGAFYMGSGNGENDRFGPGYILDRDVVLVTFNYRLGPLGEYRNFKIVFVYRFGAVYRVVNILEKFFQVFSALKTSMPQEIMDFSTSRWPCGIIFRQISPNLFQSSRLVLFDVN